VSDLAAAAEFREGERRRFHDATHHAYAVLLSDGERRHDDDGEPSGSAGRPSMGAIERAGLVDVVVVVTRYFGGTKLGTGGLSRAYGTAAALALAGTPWREVVRARRVLLEYDYPDTGLVVRALESAGAVRTRERYGDRAELEVTVPVLNLERLLVAVSESTAGRARFEELQAETLLPVET
jgi:putative IMPACT (imprinted ancient) family translation regulator